MIDFNREADCCRKMGELLAADPNLRVPRVIDALSTGRVFTTELIPGLTIDRCVGLAQEVRNRIAQLVMDLTLRELFIHK